MAFFLTIAGIAAWILQAAAPPLEFQSPPELDGIRARLESMDAGRMDDILRLTGLDTAGGEIRVVLATESSPQALRVPAWTAGFAISAEGLIVIFPARSPAYPHYSLEDVLRHEIAHVLIHRASGGGTVPRWFHEGLAMAAERDWGFDDQTRLLYQLIVGRRTRLDELERLFSGGRSDQTRAYALAGALVRDLMQRTGDAAPARILARMRAGRPFHLAFADVAGVLPATAEYEFWQSRRLWTTWVPLATSSATLWALILALALWARRRRRQRDTEIEQSWDEEVDDRTI